MNRPPRTLRQWLDDVSREGGSEHWRLLEQARYAFGHAIEVQELIERSSNWREQQYNCFMFALTVHRNELVRNLARRNAAFANAALVKQLIALGTLREVRTGEASEGDVVIYFAAGEPKHAGKLSANGRVSSKWGTGNRYLHALFEIPESHGDSVRYFRSVEEPVIARALLEIASSC